jgi:hypothetical protein
MTPVQLNSTKKRVRGSGIKNAKENQMWYCSEIRISSLYQIIRTSEHIARLGKKGSRPNPLPLLRTAMPTETGYLQSEVSLNKASRADAHNLHRCLRSSRIAGLHMGTNIQHRKRIKLIHILLPAHWAIIDMKMSFRIHVAHSHQRAQSRGYYSISCQMWSVQKGHKLYCKHVFVYIAFHRMAIHLFLRYKRICK